MAWTLFQDYNQNTPIVSNWLNDVNNDVYTPQTGIPATPGGTPRTALQQAAAWVRFSVIGGVVAIEQSSNIASVTRVSAGLYQITYGNTMINTTNCYSISTNLAGFQTVVAESTTTVEVNISNTANVSTDPGFVSVVIFGAN
jgi:hypothetical protein